MPKVLLVEDDNNLREIFEMRLQAEGYKTISASDGEEALVVAVKEKPDLVIADVMMPKLSGFEMVENMRAAPDLANVKVIMMTALGQAEDRARGQKLGVIKYLVKSQVTLEDFVRVVREVLPPDGSASTAPSTNPPAEATSSTENINNKPGSELSRGSASISEADSRESLLPSKQESEQTMQDDNTTPTNPTPPADPGMPPADPTAPADPMGGSSDPANPITTPPSTGDMSGSGQQTTAQEETAVDNQINDFASNPDAGMPPASDQPAAPANPVANDAPAPTEPPAETPPAPAEPDGEHQGDAPAPDTGSENPPTAPL